MVLRIGIVGGIIFALACCCVGQSRPDLILTAKSITSEDQVHEWLTYYYLHPRPDLTVSALRAMYKNGWFEKGVTQTPAWAFLARIFISNPERLSVWVDETAKDPDDEKLVMSVGFWMANERDSLRALAALSRAASPAVREKIDVLSRKQPPDLLKDELTTPQFLDALWASFFATGDDRYIQRLIGALPFRDSKDTTKMLIGGAAQWSLTSNAVQHPKVMQICEAELARLPNDDKPRLKAVIESAHEKIK